jgi:hypothetical protein
VVVEGLQGLNQLRQSGKMHWSEHEQAWAAEPRDVVAALAHEGFAEYKLAVTRSRRDRPPTGGVWQGLNLQTGAVASAIWVQRTPEAESIVFIDIDGELIDGVTDNVRVAGHRGAGAPPAEAHSQGKEEIRGDRNAGTDVPDIRAGDDRQR